MVRETEREEQLAVARRLPTNVVVQLPDAEPLPAYVPAPKSMMTTGDNTSAQPATTRAETSLATTTPTSMINLPQSSNALANAIAQLTGDAPPAPTALVNKANSAAPPAVEVAQPSNVMPMPLPATTAAAVKTETATDNSAKEQPRAATPSLGDKIKGGLFGKPPAPLDPVLPVVEARLMAEGQEMSVGQKQRIALVLISKEKLGNTLARLHFDPRFLAVRGISQGPWADGAQTAPIIMQSIDPSGMIMLAISPQANAPLKSGANVVLYLEVEALAVGESAITFGDNAQSATFDGRGVKMQMMESRITVK
jgi:hypothetical protein